MYPHARAYEAGAPKPIAINRSHLIFPEPAPLPHEHKPRLSRRKLRRLMREMRRQTCRQSKRRCESLTR
jgi:hypothetical protein